MMKQFFTFFLAVIIAQTLFSQGFVLDGAQDTTYLTSDVDFIELTPTLTNNSSGDLTLSVERIENNLSGAHQNHFCWNGICYGDDTDSPLTNPVVGAGQKETSFLLSFHPHSDTGTSVLTYRFFDFNDPTAKVEFTFTFIVTAGPASDISDEFEALGYSLSAPYPQPAGNNVFFNYELPAGVNAELVLTDLAGRSLKQVELTSAANRAEISTASLNPGYYVAMMVSEGKTLGSRKLVVR